MWTGVVWWRFTANSTHVADRLLFFLPEAFPGWLKSALNDDIIHAGRTRAESGARNREAGKAMKIFEEIGRVAFGDMTAMFFREKGKICFTLVPAGMEEEIPEHCKLLNDTVGCRGYTLSGDRNVLAIQPESAVQFKIAGDAYWDNFSAGRTLRNSGSVDQLLFDGLRQEEGNAVLLFHDARGLRLEQTMRHLPGRPWIEINTTLTNSGSDVVTVEMLSSFSLGLLSPFQPDDGVECYRIHRWSSNWSGEGRHESRSVEELGMERSWSAYGVRVLRFGERGSMPVRGYFPQVAFEDTRAGVTWGAALSAVGSWQLEVSRFCDFFNLSGGMVDREFGQWTRRLAPGESICGPAAVVSCTRGGIDELLPRLTAYQEEEVDTQPASEQDLPVIFNEWCTTWGKPLPGNLMPVLETLHGCNVKYFVLDAGWFHGGVDALCGIGDWNVPPENYPDGGIGAFTEVIRNAGFRPGIWFEFEVATEDSKLANEHPEWLLHLDGKVLKSGTRRFLDFRNPAVIEYLGEKVIRFLRDNGFGYMKVDYNGPTGFGCDGREVPAEELRLHMEAVENFFRRIRRELPDLVIEICSSGGHRLTAGWMRIGAMASSTDVHEGVEIPIVGANVARLIPMRHNQLWATLRSWDDSNRLHYSLAAGLLGRLCLSGDIAKLDEAQRKIMFDGVEFYRACVPAIRRGRTRLIRDMAPSFTRPRGSQIVFRSGETCDYAVIHTFGEGPASLRVPLGEKRRLRRVFAPEGVSCRVNGNELAVTGLVPFTGCAFLLER